MAVNPTRVAGEIASEAVGKIPSKLRGIAGLLEEIELGGGDPRTISPPIANRPNNIPKKRRGLEGLLDDVESGEVQWLQMKRQQEQAQRTIPNLALSGSVPRSSPAGKQKTSFLGRVSRGDVAGKDSSLSTNRYTFKGVRGAKDTKKAKPYVFTDTEYDVDVIKSIAGQNDRTRHRPYDLPDYEPAVRTPGMNDGTRYKPYELPDDEPAIRGPKESPGVMHGPQQIINGGLTPGFGGSASMLGGGVVGGTVAYMGSTTENRNFGTFAKGAAFGVAGGAMVSGLASKGMMSASSEWAQGVSQKIGFGEGFTENMVNAARSSETASSRSALFAAGAMLGGGMFGTNRNRAQGLNSTRGNRFGG